MFFKREAVNDYKSAKTSDTARYAAFFHRMLDTGIHFAPAQFEAAFISAAHKAQDIDFTISAAKMALEPSYQESSKELEKG